MAVVARELEVEGSLAALGLSIEIFHNALALGMGAYESTSKLAPTTAAGTNFSNSVVVSLRSQLLPLGWVMSNRENFSSTISPDGRILVYSARGDDNTGIKGDKYPTTKSPKGRLTSTVINKNLFLPGMEPLDEAPDLKFEEAWLFLFNYNKGFILSELSKPISFREKDGRPDDYETRLILPPITLENPGKMDNNNLRMDVDVPVEPR